MHAQGKRYRAECAAGERVLPPRISRRTLNDRDNERKLFLKRTRDVLAETGFLRVIHGDHGRPFAIVRATVALSLSFLSVFLAIIQS